MTFQKQNYFQRRNRQKLPKANERIRAKEVQVISAEGQNLGTLPTQEAINIAKQKGLDLIVTGQSSRGTITNDKYTLKGFTASSNKLSSDCK